MKPVITLFFCVILFSSIGFSQQNSDLHRMEMITTDADSKVEKKVIIFEDKKEIERLLSESGFPDEVLSKIKKDMKNSGYKLGDEYEFADNINGKEFVCKLGAHQSMQAKETPSKQNEKRVIRKIKPLEQAFLGMKIEAYLFQNEQKESPIRGVLVTEVIDGEAAYNAGIKTGDIITKLNGVSTPSPSLFKEELSKLKPRDEVQFEFVRENKTLSGKAMAGAISSSDYSYDTKDLPYFITPNTDLPENIYPFFQQEEFGLDQDKLYDLEKLLSNQNKAALGVFITDSKQGAAIKSFMDDSAAKDAGLEEGDIITKIDKKNISTPEDLIDAIGEYDVGDVIAIEFLRNGKKRKVKATLKKAKEMEFFFAPNLEQEEEIIEQ